jgi:hypothetical protein
MLSAIVDGIETSLDDGTLCLLVGHQGWGQASVERYSSRGPLQDGDTDIDFRLEPRIGTLILKLPATELDDMYARRKLLEELFSPLNDITLKFAMAYGDRYIECHYYDQMGMDWAPRAWAAQNVLVKLKCNDPTFYDLEAAAVTFGQSGGGGGTVPTPVPTPVGSSTLNESAAVTYAGRYYAFPSLVRITGPITDAVIYNDTLGLKLDFTGNTISAGHYVDIDLRYAKKTVKLDGVTRWIDKLTTDSDLSRWRISPAPDASGGVNVLRVTGSSVNSSTRVDVNYRNQQLGI